MAEIETRVERDDEGELVDDIGRLGYKDAVTVDASFSHADATIAFVVKLETSGRDVSTLSQDDATFFEKLRLSNRSGYMKKNPGAKANTVDKSWSRLQKKFVEASAQSDEEKKNAVDRHNLRGVADGWPPVTAPVKQDGSDEEQLSEDERPSKKQKVFLFLFLIFVFVN
jgi:hypothetical protein